MDLLDWALFILRFFRPVNDPNSREPNCGGVRSRGGTLISYPSTQELYTRHLLLHYFNKFE